MTERVTASEYARRIGVTPGAVTRAIKTGRITAEKRDGKWMIDPEGAAREWAESTKYRIEASGARELQKAIGAGPRRSIKDSRAMREEYEARLARLKYETAVGELIRADEAESTWCSIVALARTKLLAVPSRAKIRMPELSAEQVTAVEELIRDALEELSEDHGGADEGGAGTAVAVP